MDNDTELEKKSLVPPRVVEIMEEVFHVVLGFFPFRDRCRSADLLGHQSLHHHSLLPNRHDSIDQ